MPLLKRDREFRLPKISHIDFKHIEMDRVLLGLFERIAHGGYPSRFRQKRELTVKDFVDEIMEHPEQFKGFNAHREIVERWVETHLMDIVNRGKRNEAVAGPRPLHGFTYRFRNPKHARDYGAAQQIYEVLVQARNSAGTHAIEHLKSFFFDGYDKVTNKVDPNAVVDIETVTLLHFLSQRKDEPDTGQLGDRFAPLCIGSADLLAEDVQRLLFYRSFIPRSVMVDYLKLLLSFHTALYHLRLLKLLPALVRRKAGDPICETTTCPVDPRRAINPQGECPYRLGMLTDLTGNPESAVAHLAERSADAHYRRIPGFVRAYFVTKKLDEFAEDQIRKGKLIRPQRGGFPVGEILALQRDALTGEREKFFGARLSSVLEDMAGEEKGLDPELASLAEMDLSEFDKYIEFLVALRGAFHRKYITECLDTLMQKNRLGALLVQGRTRNAHRRFVLDSRLLEVLLQIAVLQPSNGGFRTGEMRIDELLSHLRERYGLYIDQLPMGDGFGPASIEDRQALRDNVKAFLSRLREIGFFRDLSDAYVTQTVTPRYRIGENAQGVGA
ncbi:MAG: hypothetical protein KF804_00930 [Burkholderiales bacterium]|nr:hypothetical protein [Burkholderiales bacterium]